MRSHARSAAASTGASRRRPSKRYNLRFLSPTAATSMELAKSFEPHAIESKWYPIWESRGYFKPTYAPGAPAYCIQLPPPNVTGTLHMGHAFQHTLMDVLIR